MKLKDLVWPTYPPMEVGEAKHLINIFDPDPNMQLIKHLKMCNKDVIWKTFAKSFPAEMAAYFLPKEVRNRLDLSKPVFLDLELSSLIKLDGASKDQMFVDQIIEYPRIDDPNKRERIHFEFQEAADLFFTKRTAMHMRYLYSYPDIPVTTFAIIHKTKGSFRNNFLMGTEDNGVRFKFQHYDISSKKESEFLDRPDCLISQVVYSIWLSGNKKMSIQDKYDKFVRIFKNIRKLKLQDRARFYVRLFILKNLYSCCLSDEDFCSFVNINNYLIGKKKIMTVLEVIEQNGISIGEKRGEQRGISIGEKRGISIGEQRRDETVIRKLLGRNWEPSEIAQFMETTIEHVLEVKRKM